MGFWNLKEILGFIIILEGTFYVKYFTHIQECSLRKQLSFAPAPSGVSQNTTPDREQRRTAVFAGHQEYYMGKENKQTERNTQCLYNFPLSDDC